MTVKDQHGNCKESDTVEAVALRILNLKKTYSILQLV